MNDSLSEIAVDPVEAESLIAAIQQLDALHRKLGDVRCRYLAEERAIETAVSSAEKELTVLHRLISAKYLKDKPGVWDFDAQAKRYVRR